jgi:DNA-binding transcriptional MerR regulator
MPKPDISPDDDASIERFSIDELSSLAGVTPRTVRYYIAEGLIDRPQGEKRGAHYLRRHLEQLLLIRRWTDAGVSLERVRELMAGAPEDPAPRRSPPGSVEVWSRVTVADGLEVHLEPGRAGLTPEEVRQLVRGITALYRDLRTAGSGASRNTASHATRSTRRENRDE